MKYLNNIEYRIRQRNQRLRNDLKDEAIRLGQVLKGSGFKFKRLYLFGSLTKEDRPILPWSDIDLAIEGLPANLYYKTYALLLRSAKFNVDLKPFEQLDEAIKGKVKKDGMVICGAR